MNIYIENIDKIKNSHKHYAKQWRTIYEVIQQEFFDETEIFPDDFIKHFKNNTNESHNIPIEVKNNIKKIRWNKNYMHKLSCFVRKI